MKMKNNADDTDGPSHGASGIRKATAGGASSSHVQKDSACSKFLEELRLRLQKEGLDRLYVQISNLIQDGETEVSWPANDLREWLWLTIHDMDCFDNAFAGALSAVAGLPADFSGMEPLWNGTSVDGISDVRPLWNGRVEIPADADLAAIVQGVQKWLVINSKTPRELQAVQEEALHMYPMFNAIGTAAAKLSAAKATGKSNEDLQRAIKRQQVEISRLQGLLERSNADPQSIAVQIKACRDKIVAQEKTNKELDKTEKAWVRKIERQLRSGGDANPQERADRERVQLDGEEKLCKKQIGQHRIALAACAEATAKVDERLAKLTAEVDEKLISASKNVEPELGPKGKFGSLVVEPDPSESRQQQEEDSAQEDSAQDQREDVLKDAGADSAREVTKGKKPSDPLARAPITPRRSLGQRSQQQQQRESSTEKKEVPKPKLLQSSVLALERRRLLAALKRCESESEELSAKLEQIKIQKRNQVAKSQQLLHRLPARERKRVQSAFDQGGEAAVTELLASQAEAQARNAAASAAIMAAVRLPKLGAAKTNPSASSTTATPPASARVSEVSKTAAAAASTTETGVTKMSAQEKLEKLEYKLEKLVTAGEGKNGCPADATVVRKGKGRSKGSNSKGKGKGKGKSKGSISLQANADTDANVGTNAAAEDALTPDVQQDATGANALALQELQHWMREGNMPKLQQALEAARAVGLTGEDVSKAEGLCKSFLLFAHIHESVPSEETPLTYEVVYHGGAQVRAGHDLGTEGLGEVSVGSMVSVVEIRGRHARVIHPHNGWISLHSEEEVLISGMDIIKPWHVSQPSNAKPLSYKVVHPGGAVLRAGDALNSEKVSELPQNTKVAVVETKGRRAKVLTATCQSIVVPMAGWVSTHTRGGIISNREKILEPYYDEYPTEESPLCYKVVSADGAIVRTGVELTTEFVTEINVETLVSVVEIRERRARILEPVKGWISLHAKGHGVISHRAQILRRCPAAEVFRAWRALVATQGLRSENQNLRTDEGL